jgi:hypothetical protein
MAERTGSDIPHSLRHIPAGLQDFVGQAAGVVDGAMASMIARASTATAPACTSV